jgi:flavin-dependent dehydrogenase
MRSSGSRREPDVAVIGAGPAGATAAALLAGWGWRVVLLHRKSGRHSLAESLPPSIRKLLRVVGALDAVERAGFHPNRGNISNWAGQPAVVSTETPGYHVSRAALDRLLLDHARTQGARIVEGQVGSIDLSGNPLIDCSISRGVTRYRPAFVLDCSGRAGVVARRGLRRTERGYRTLAVTAEWETPGWPDGERAHTFVDSYRDGWAWSVPLSPTRRQCTVMIDADRMPVSRATLAAVYARELGKAVSITARLSNSRQTSAPWACDASLYSCLRASESRALLVGDAASFIEPLSSAGVKKALASAWRAAVVVNTALRTPGLLAAASAYHDQRERDVYDDCVRRSAGFFEQAAAAYEDEFWGARARTRAGRNGGVGTSHRQSSGEEVRQAFDALRQARMLDVAPARSLRFERVPVIEGREIVLREAVSVPGLAEPVRFADGINVPELIRIAAGSSDVASLIDWYHRDVGATDPRNLLGALSGLIAGGILVDRRSATTPPPVHPSDDRIRRDRGH